MGYRDDLIRRLQKDGSWNQLTVENQTRFQNLTDEQARYILVMDDQWEMGDEKAIEVFGLMSLVQMIGLFKGALIEHGRESMGQLSNTIVDDNPIRRAEARQNRIETLALVISVCLAVCFSAGFVSNIARSGQPSDIRLDVKINPNDAPIASLVRLPGIGTGRARAIVAYREGFSKKESSCRTIRPL